MSKLLELSEEWPIGTKAKFNSDVITIKDNPRDATSAIGSAYYCKIIKDDNGFDGPFIAGRYKNGKEDGFPPHALTKLSKELVAAGDTYKVDTVVEINGAEFTVIDATKHDAYYVKKKTYKSAFYINDDPNENIDSLFISCQRVKDGHQNGYAPRLIKIIEKDENNPKDKTYTILPNGEWGYIND